MPLTPPEELASQEPEETVALKAGILPEEKMAVWEAKERELAARCG